MKRQASRFPLAGEAHASDPAVYEQLVHPWELLCTPAKAGEFGYRIRYLRLPQATVYQEHFALACRIRGLSPDGVLALAVPTQLGRNSRYWKAPVSGGGILMMQPGELHGDIETEQTQLLVLLDHALLQSHFHARQRWWLERVAALHLLPASPLAVVAFGQWLLSLLQLVTTRSDIQSHPASLRSMQEDLLKRLAALVDAAHGLSGPRDEIAGASKRRQGLDRALAFLRVVSADTVTVAQLREAADVSLRTLEYAFREAFDLTPLAYLRLQRLHAAHRDLVNESAARRTVAHIALDHGFYQLGRFSADYQRLFGRLPSDTLRRSAPPSLDGHSLMNA